MNTRFKPIGVKPVERYRLQFETREGFEEARKRIREVGFLLFNNSKGDGLVGRLVRFSVSHRVVEVDAAEDLGDL